MKVIEVGHRYLLAGDQVLRFLQKVPSVQRDELVTVSDGTTNEELLEVLIDRLKHLQEKLPCRENAIVLTKLEESLMWLTARTSARLRQGVENTAAPHSA